MLDNAPFISVATGSLDGLEHAHSNSVDNSAQQPLMRGIVRNEPITLTAEKGYPVQMTLSPPDRASVEAVLEALRPSIKADGGDVELVDITDDGIVRVRLLGACIGCPSSQMTLRGGIEANLVGRIPGVTGVEAVEAA